MRLASGSSSRVPGTIENAVKGDINVTPLVDVCLVLLIIFMVVTPMLQKGVDVPMPETDQPEKMPEGANQMTVAIKTDGTVFVDKVWLPKDRLLAEFKKIYEESPEKVAVIKADKKLPYKQVREVMKALNQAGFPGAGLVTLKKGKPAA